MEFRRGTVRSILHLARWLVLNPRLQRRQSVERWLGVSLRDLRPKGIWAAQTGKVEADGNRPASYFRFYHPRSVTGAARYLWAIDLLQRNGLAAPELLWATLARSWMGWVYAIGLSDVGDEFDVGSPDPIVESFKARNLAEPLYLRRHRKGANSKQVRRIRAVGDKIVQYLGSQRAGGHPDDLEKGDVAHLRNAVDRFLAPYNRDKTLIHRQYATTFARERLRWLGVRTALDGWLQEPLKVASWRAVLHTLYLVVAG